MKTICIDAGNTLIKVAFAEDSAIRSVVPFALADSAGLMHHISSLPQADACILSSVSTAGREIANALSRKAAYFVELSDATPIPVRNLYKTPETLGRDRLAAVIGAHGLFSGKDILVMDAGTALTVDFIDSSGNYLGGNISPGLSMRFRALHDYTGRLPLQTKADDYPLLGDTTASAIVAGVQNGMIFEINNYVSRFAGQYPGLVTVMTGGDAVFLANKMEKHTFTEPNLVFIGLDKIIEFNWKG